MKHKQLAKFLLVQFAILFIAVVISIFIKPSGLEENSGVSYYAVQPETALLIYFSFLSSSIILLYSAFRMPKKSRNEKLFTFCLILAAICYIGLVLTPHDIIAIPHKIFGSMLFAMEFIASYFILMKTQKLSHLLLFIVAFISGLASLVYLFIHGYMIQAQLIFQLAVWTVIISYLKSSRI
jgi:hypothetical protein